MLVLFNTLTPHTFKFKNLLENTTHVKVNETNNIKCELHIVLTMVDRQIEDTILRYFRFYNNDIYVYKHIHLTLDLLIHQNFEYATDAHSLQKLCPRYIGANAEIAIYHNGSWNSSCQAEPQQSMQESVVRRICIMNDS